MAIQSVRLFSFLLVSVTCTILVVLFQGNLPGSNRWTNVFRSRGENGSISSDETWETENAINYRTTRRNSVTTPKTEKTTPAETPIPMLYLKSFDKLPQRDFEDVYNQDVPPRLTTCAQSLHNSKDEAFQKAFLPNIRLYLHRDNMNMSEWNRLSHFNNPFGFMQMKYDDVMPSLKLIPKPAEPLLLPKPGGDGCVHCAVVGTGGILNGSKMGAEIDAHDYVFRMNGAAIKGYEEDVGRRTSVYVHTAHSITTSPYLLEKYGYKSAPHDEGIKYVLIPEGVRDFQWLRALLKGNKVSSGEYENEDARTYYSGQFNENRFYILHQDFMRYVRNRFLKSYYLDTEYWSIVRPTNGAFAIFLALHTCDTIVTNVGNSFLDLSDAMPSLFALVLCKDNDFLVSAYGFMTEDYSKYSNYYVEKSQKTDIIFYANHDYILEKDLWKSLHDKKIMKLYQRTETQKETEKPKQT